MSLDNLSPRRKVQLLLAALLLLVVLWGTLGDVLGP